MYILSHIYIYMYTVIAQMIYIYFLNCLVVCLFIYQFGYIPMRHAARTPPPLDFVVFALLRLTAFRTLQNVLKSFEVNVRYYLCSEVPLHFSAVAFCCVVFVPGCDLLKRYGGIYAKIPLQTIKNQAWWIPTSINNHTI